MTKGLPRPPAIQTIQTTRAATSHDQWPRNPSISPLFYSKVPFHFPHKHIQPTNIPDLSSRQLHAVLTVAEYNSFIAAAAFLKTSQPALTRTIKRVEDYIGMRLV